MTTDNWTTKVTAATDSAKGALAVINCRVREGQREGYDRWLGTIGAVCSGYRGYLDLQVIRPITGMSATYTVIIRFDTLSHLEAWLASRERKSLLAEIRPLLVTDDDFYVQSGLDFWFTPEGGAARAPVRWKQFLVTWSAIFPLVLGVALLTTPVMRALGLPRDYYFETLAGTGVVCLLMCYVVMPRYTPLVKRWLSA